MVGQGYIVTSEPTSFVSATEELNGGGLVLSRIIRIYIS